MVTTVRCDEQSPTFQGVPNVTRSAIDIPLNICLTDYNQKPSPKGDTMTTGNNTTNLAVTSLEMRIRQELRRIEEQTAYALEALNEGGTNGSLRFGSDLELAPMNIATSNIRLAELVATYTQVRKGI